MNAADLLLADLPDVDAAWSGSLEGLYRHSWPAAEELLRKLPDGRLVLGITSYVYPEGIPHPFESPIEEEDRPDLEKRVVHFEVTREQAALWLLGRAIPPAFRDLFTIRP